MSIDDRTFTRGDIDKIERALTGTVVGSMLERKRITPDDIRVLCALAAMALRIQAGPVQ